MPVFSIDLTDGPVAGEYRTGDNVVIFSHGFDVRRDSLGLFSDIAASLPDDWGWVQFDYHLYNSNDEMLRSPNAQVRTLVQVVHWARQQLKPQRIHLIAHSMGCMIASLAAITDLDSVIYLAPQLVDGQRLVDFFSGHPRLARSNDQWQLTRRGGQVTHLSKDFLREVRVLRPLPLHTAYAAHQPITVIVGEQDTYVPTDQIKKLATSPGVRLISLPGDHNFTGIQRRLLLREVARLLA